MEKPKPSVAFAEETLAKKKKDDIIEEKKTKDEEEKPALPPLRLIHIDLKGARPQLNFWISFCQMLRDWGDVNGLILEWEDSFPLNVLRSFQQDNAYSRVEAVRMVKVAEDCGFLVIPLVQTFGHLEYVLKYFSHLREQPGRPDCLRPIESFSDEAFVTVTGLIDDVLSICPNCPAIHLGGDEVWHLGNGIRSQERIERGETKADLYLKHYSFILDYVRNKYPDKRIMLWDDMLRSAPFDVLNRFDYGLIRDHVELCVWQYSENPEACLPPDLLTRYGSIFRQGIWAATAFKGATSSCALIPTIATHVNNHLAWQGMLQNRKNFVKVQGYILTGWQRFDHFASLCEFLPVAIPSLRCCLTALKSLKFGVEELELCKSVLGMPNIPLEVYPRPQAIPSDIRSFRFPGADLYVLIQRFVNAQCSAKALLNHDAMTTWFSDWQVKNNRCSMLQVRVIMNNVQMTLDEMNYLEKCLVPVMAEIFDKPTGGEWLGTYSEPLIKQLLTVRNRAKEVLERGGADGHAPPLPPVDPPISDVGILPPPPMSVSPPPVAPPTFYEATPPPLLQAPALAEHNTSDDNFIPFAPPPMSMNTMMNDNYQMNNFAMMNNMGPAPSYNFQPHPQHHNQATFY